MASLSYLEIILAVICFCFFWCLRNFNDLIWNWPFLGMLPSLLSHVHRAHDRCLEVLQQAGGTFHFKGPWRANMDFLGTVDPANIHYIMSSNFSNFPKGSEFKMIFDLFGDGIFNSDSDAWKNQRNLTRVLITHQKFLKFLINTTMNKLEQGLIPILEDVAKNGKEVDLQDVLQRFTFDTTCIFVTGYDPGCLSTKFPDVPFPAAMGEAEEAIFMRHCIPERIWKLQKKLGVGHEKKLAKARVTLDHVVYKYISMKREELLKKANKVQEDDKEGPDLLTTYINGLDETTNLKFDDKFLRDTILNLMFAGRDTTSSALTWFIWLVSTHPDVEKNIREELKQAIKVPSKEAQQWRLFKVEEVRNLVYLHGALCESLRLYPPVPFQHKAPFQVDILPSGHKVHPNMKILFPLYAMGRMPWIWGKDCLEFKPERWINMERGTIKNEPSYKFFSFNAGPRTCLGKEVAFTQMKAVAAAIIHNYQVQVVKGHNVTPNVSIILYMKHGLRVRVTKKFT